MMKMTTLNSLRFPPLPPFVGEFHLMELAEHEDIQSEKELKQSEAVVHDENNNAWFSTRRWPVIS